MKPFSVFKKFSVVIRTSNRKSICRILYECFLLFVKFKAIPVHYFGRFLYIKGVTNIYDYVPNQIIYSLWSRFNDNNLIHILDNKLLFYNYYKALNINTIDILAYNYGNTFLLSFQTKTIRNGDQFLDLLTKLLSVTKSKSLYIKQCYSSSGGKNVYKIDENDLKNEDNIKHKLYYEIIHSSFIIQETVIAHKDISAINPHCLNSLRIDTFLNQDGTAEVISAFLRYGVQGSIVDNTSLGGSQVGIDLKTAKLDKFGFATISDGNGMIYEAHPDTHIVFEGYEIPLFKESLELVKKAAESTPGLRLIGWDVAVLPDGPVLIEGNHDYDMTGTDLALGGCFKSPVFIKIILEAGIRIPNYITTR